MATIIGLTEALMLTTVTVKAAHCFDDQLLLITHSQQKTEPILADLAGIIRDRFLQFINSMLYIHLVYAALTSSFNALQLL